VELALSYTEQSGVNVADGTARVHLSGALERPALRYRGVIKHPLALREFMGALHDVVIADFRWRPPETRLAFERWLQYQLDQQAAAEAGRIDRERRRYFEYLWATDRALWWVLDPVCSVHPDQVFFEAFSRDGSAYARVGLDRGGCDEVGETVCGTTNVDFSTGLYESIRRLRTIWKTELDLGHDAVTLETEGAERHTEKKVDLPESWIQGFVQIGAAFLLDALAVDLLPVHVYDLCRFLRLHKARTSPRALRWELTPGEPVSVVFEPWEHRMTFAGSTHTASEKRIIRLWGRRRLCLLERVIPQADSFRFHLLGRGLPYFVTARAGVLDFTLGLSGWSRADWTSTARFSALVARRGGTSQPSDKPLAWLKTHYLGTPAEIAKGSGVDETTVHASLVDAAGRGLVVFDLLHKVYRYRPLIPGGLPEGLGVGQDPKEIAAKAFVRSGAAKLTGSRRDPKGTLVRARVTEDAEHVYAPEITIGETGKVLGASCDCFFAKEHGIKQGLCEHQLALLLLYD
jgi:hypothetical protein